VIAMKVAARATAHSVSVILIERAPDPPALTGTQPSASGGQAREKSGMEPEQDEALSVMRLMGLRLGRWTPVIDAREFGVLRRSVWALSRATADPAHKAHLLLMAKRWLDLAYHAPDQSADPASRSTKRRNWSRSYAGSDQQRIEPLCPF